MKKKTSIIVSLGLLASMTLSVGLCMTNIDQAQAETTVQILTDDRLTLDGASVRVKASAEDTTDNGVRFRVGMTMELYNELLNAEGTGFREGVTTGTLLIPTDLLEGDLTLSTKDATKQDTTTKWYQHQEEGEETTSMKSMVYLWDIPEEIYGSDISAVGYIQDTVNNTVTYTEQVNRSMSWVAKEEYYDTTSKLDSETKAELKAKYVDKKVTTTVDGTLYEYDFEYGDLLSDKVQDPTKDGYTFDGWFNNAGTAKWNTEDKIINPINVRAQFTRNAGYEVLVDPNSTVASDYEVKNDGKDGSASDLKPTIVDGTETIGTTEKVIKINVANGAAGVVSNGHFIFHCKNLTKARMQNFDYITVYGYADNERNDGLAFNAASGWQRDTAIRQADQKGAFSYTIPAQYWKDDTFRFGFSDYTGTGTNRLQNLYITSIVGGYNAVETDEELDLLTKTVLTDEQLAETYFEDTQGVRTTIDNLSAFTPTEAGKIGLKLNVKGYAPSIVEIKVDFVPAYNDFLLLSANDKGKYIVSQRGYETQISSITQTIIDGSNTPEKVDSKVLSIDLSKVTTGNGHIQLNISNISNTQLKYFDYYTIVGYVDYTGNNFTVGTMSVIPTDERLAKVEGAFTYDVKSAYFGTGYLQFCFGDYTRNEGNPAQNVYIYSITGGYNDVAVSETSFSLVEKTGFTEEQIAESYFVPTGGTRQEIEDLTAFTPSQEGQIMLVISMEGYKKTTVTINVTAQA